MADKHRFTFFRAGGVDQVVVATADDLLHLSELDQKLWVALACPTKGTEIDSKTLELVDDDDDGRIRPPEVLRAIEWSAKVVKSLDLFFEKGTALPLTALSKDSAEGKAVLKSAKRILKDQGKKDATEIEVEDVLAMEKVFAATRFNGDGIVPADAADDPAFQKAIEDVIAAVGSVVDRSGKPGVDKKLVEDFFTQSSNVLAWDAAQTADGVMVAKEGTAAAADALEKVEAKIGDYFTRARLARFEVRAAAALNPAEADIAAMAGKVLSAASEDVAKLPLAHVEAGKPLPLEAGLNPAWHDAIAAFAKSAVEPLLGGHRATLTEEEFASVASKLAPFRKWRSDKPTNAVDKLGIARLGELEQMKAKDAILALIAKDEELQAEYLEIASVEKACRYRRDLVKLTRNFVNFAEFYRRRGASFQAGTLFLDARSCDLCLYVEDAAKHAALAGLSKAYLAYCDITRKSGEKAQIVAAFTAGDVDNLMVGRNGVFYDRKGNDWDATITAIVSNPISVRQAFWSPYKRLVRLVEEQIAKRAAEKEKESTAKIDATALVASRADQHQVASPTPPGAVAASPAAVLPPPPPPPPPAPGAPVPPVPDAKEPQKVDLGIIVGIGVAIGAIAGFLTSVLTMFLGLGWWMPLGVVAVLLGISGPSMLIAWLKLRQRNLGPILDACGWAVNGRAKINVPFGGSLTAVAALPEGATRTAGDPFAEKPTPWGRWVALFVFVALLLLWLLGTADRFIPEKARFKSIVHANSSSAPASSTPPPASAAPAAPPAK